MPAQVAVGVSQSLDTVEAFSDACAEVERGLGGPVDLCVLFAGAAHVGREEAALEVVRERIEPRRLIGCAAAGVVGTGREIEDGPGAVVWAARLPGAELETFHAEGEPGSAAEEIEGIPNGAGPPDAAIVLADPFGFPAEALLARFEQQWPGRPVLGGLASAAIDGGARLLVDGEVVEGGAVGCAITGAEVIPCVSQGATPVGPEMTITAAEGNVVAELASKPALERLGEVVTALPVAERAQAAAGMLIGIVIDENRPEHRRGDFLVRPIVGAEREQGAIAIGEPVRVGQTVRLHVRDGESADADLREALAAQSGALGAGGAAGALIFTCNGRGAGLFDVADHDAEAFDEVIGAPLGGFFCAGEIGPVGGHNFLHGFTATIAVFAAD